MDTREIFKKAFSNVQSFNSFPEHDKAFKDVLERAKNMNSNNDGTKIYGAQVSDLPPAEKKHRVFGIIAGVAGTAAVLAGAVFGLKWLNDNGGLKGPDAQGSAASGGNSAYTVEAAQAVEKIDISELAGKTFTFSDMTTTVDFATYDGQFIRYDVIETGSGKDGDSAFVLEPASVGGFKDRSPINGLIGFLDSEEHENAVKKTFIMEYSMATGNSFEFYPSSYSNKRNIERITDLIVTVSKERDSVIWQAIPDDKQELGEGVKLQYLWVSPQVLEMKIVYKDYDFAVKDPVVKAIAADGTATELKGNFVGAEVSPDKSEIVDCYYISDDPQIDLSGMKAFEINGKMFEITEKPAEFTTATAITTAPLTTVTEITTPALGEDADTTTTVTADTQENGVMLDFSSRTVSMEDYRYDGHILAAKLVGEADVINGKSLAFRSVSDPRNLVQGCLQEDGGTYTLWALLDVPEGQTDTIEIVEIPPASEGYEVGATITVDGTATSSPGIVLDADMSGYGLPGVTLESMRLSTYGLELMFSCDKANGAHELHVEILLGDVMVPIKEISGLVPYDETDGLYHACMVVTAENMFGFDLSAASSVSVNGLKVSGDELTPGGADNRPGIYETMPRRNTAE